MALLDNNLRDALRENTVNRSFDSFQSTIPERKGVSLGANLADFVGNTVYGVIDSAAFGIPTMLADRDTKTEQRSMYELPEKKYDNFLDDFGIQPMEEESGWGRAGRGVGEALGFFIPFGAVSKVTKGIGSLAVNATSRGAGKLISRSVDDGIKAISSSLDDTTIKAIKGGAQKGVNDSNTVANIIKGFLKKDRNVPKVMQSSVDDIERFGVQMERNMNDTIAHFFKENSNLTAGQIRDASKRLSKEVSDNIKLAGKKGKFVDDIEGYLNNVITDNFNKLGIDNKASRVLAGYVGRTVETTVDFYAYETLSKMARMHFGSEEELNVPEDLKNSAMFSALMTTAEMITPGLKRASSIKDIRRFLKLGAGSKRSWTKLYNNGKGKITKDEAYQALNYFSRLGNKIPDGFTGKEIASGRMPIDKVLKQLDELYSKSRNELKELVKQDTLKGIAYAIPRATADAIATMYYMSSQNDNFFNNINDEYILSDLIIGGLMAMRNPGNLDRSNKVKFRGKDGIESKFNLLEMMGADIEPIKARVSHMSEVYKNAYVNVATKEKLPEYQEIISILGSAKASNDNMSNAMSSDANSAKNRNMLRELYTNLFLGHKIVEEGVADVSSLNKLKEDGKIVDFDTLSNEEINRLWNEVKDIEISGYEGGGGKKIGEYDNFDTFYEDILGSSVRTQESNIVRSLARFGDIFGLTRAETVGEGVGDSGEELILRLPDMETLDLEGDDLDNFKQMMSLAETADKAGLIKLEVGATGDKKVNMENASKFTDALKEVTDEFNSELNELDPNYNFSKGNNPAINLISEFKAYKTRNDFNLAIDGKERRTNAPLVSAINRVFSGTTVNSTGEVLIDLGDKNYDDLEPKEQRKIDEAKEILESVAGLKIIAGQSNSSTKANKVSLDEALSFAKEVEDQGYMSFIGDNLYINGSLKDNSIRDAKERIFNRSDLGVADWIALGRLKNTGDFEVTSDGKVKLPTPEAMEVALYQRSEKSDDSLGLSREEAAEKRKQYEELISRLQNSGSVEMVTKFSGEINARELSDVIEGSLTLVNGDARDGIDGIRKQILQSRENRHKTMAEVKELHKKLNTDNNLTDTERLNVLRKIKEKMGSANSGAIMTTDVQKYLSYIDKIINSSNSDSNNRLTADLFKDLKSEFDKIESFSKRLHADVNKLTTNVSSSYAYSAQANFLRTNILRELNMERSEKDLVDLFNEYRENSSYENLTNLINRSRRIFSYQMEQFEYERQVENSSTQINELLDTFTQEDHDISKQSLLKKLKEVGSDIVDAIDDSHFSPAAKQMLENTSSKKVNEFIEKVFNELAQNENYDADEVAREVASTIYSFRSRSDSQKTFQLRKTKDGASDLVYAPDETSPSTKLTDFANEVDGLTIIKDEYVDSRGRKTTITSNADNFNDFFYGGESQRSVRFKDVNPSKEISDKKTAQRANHIFIPVQDSEKIGFVFSDSRENATNLYKKVNDWINEVEDWINDPKNNISEDQKYRFETFIKNQRDNLLNDKGNLNIKETESLVRAMYYDNLSRELFLKTIGEKFQNVKDLQAAQAKMFKYIKNTSNDNATIITKDVGNLVEQVFRKANTDKSNRIADLLRNRIDNGINISVFEDEYDIESELGKKTSAYGTVKRSIYSNYRMMGFTEAEASGFVDDLAKTTLNELVEKEQHLKSIGQSISDGAVFASKNAMELDIGLMGGDFEKGQTSHKAVIYNQTNSSGDVGKSIIGKQNIFYDKEIAELMEKHNIDYLMPKSAAKVWGGSISEYKDFDTNKSVAQNLKNIDIASGIENYGIESMQYLFSAHKPGKGKYTASITHGWNREALLDYSNMLDIDGIVRDIAKIAGANSHQSGLEEMILRKFEDIGSEYSHLKGIEKLVKLGQTVDNTLVKDIVLRQFKKMTLDRTLEQVNENISSGFLKGNNNLRSPIYSRKGVDNNFEDQYVKAFGGVRLPAYAENVTMSEANSSIVFKLVDDDGEFQEYLLGADGKIYDPKRDTTENGDVFDDQIKSDLNLIMQRMVMGKTQGNAHRLMTVLSGIARNVKDIDRLGKNEVEKLFIDSTAHLSDFIKQDKELLEASARVIRTLKDFGIAANAQKIPKKYMSDSIVNRVEGFLTEEDGNFIEVNNYEIAVNHQADQDGDKISVYTGMPPSVLRTSANNMSLGKDFAEAGDSSPFPNLYNNSSKEGIGKGKTNSEGVLKHLATIKRSRFAIGTAVKLQGVTTMLSASNFRVSPKNGNGPASAVLNVNSKNSRNFNKRLITLLQNILDPHNGINEELLNTKGVVDFILFGDDNSALSDKLRKTANEVGGYTPVFNINEIAKNFNVNPDIKEEMDIVKDMLREVYDIHSKVYSAFGDVYDKGVPDTPTIDTYREIYDEYKRFKKSPINFISQKLGRKYYFEDRNNRNEASHKRGKLKSIITDNDNKKFTLIKEVFNFDEFAGGKDILEQAYPQMRVLSQIKKHSFGDRNDRTNKHIENFLHKEPNSVLQNIFNESPDPKNILFDMNNKKIGWLGEDFESMFSSLFGKSKDTSPFFAERMGAYFHLLQSKKNKLRQKISWMDKKGYDTSYERNELTEIKNQEKEINEKIYNASVSKTGTEEGKFYKTSPTKGMIHVSKKIEVAHIYKFNNAKKKMEFYGTLKGGQAIRAGNGEYMIAPNPITKVSMNSKLAKEGFAMEMASSSDKIESLKNTVISRYPENGEDIKSLFKKIRFNIEQAKATRRESFSETMEFNKEAPALKEDAWVDNANREAVILDNMFKKIVNDIGMLNLDGENARLLREMAARMIMQPRIVQNSYSKEKDLVIPYYKNENAWLKAVLTSEVYSKKAFGKVFDKIYKDFTDVNKKQDGIDVSIGHLFPEGTEKRLSAFKNGKNILRSLSKTSKLDPQLNFFINSAYRSKRYTDKENKEIFEYYDRSEINDVHKNCNIR